MIDIIMKVIRERRSIRKFEEKDIPLDNIKTILEAGRWAPSGMNNQPWRFLVISKDDVRKESLATCTKYGKIILRANKLVVVLIDKQVMYNETKDHQAIGACIQNMLLAAHAMGLGAVWLGEILNNEEKVLEILKLDKQKYGLMAVIALGYPAQEGKSSRKPLKELLLEEI
ncbi:nitroreductase family protein [Desulfothermus sp.]